MPMEQVVRIHASSGTTGKPTVVGYTQNDIDTWANIVALSLRAASVRRKIKFTSPTAMACLPAAWARTTVRNVTGNGDPDVWRPD
ncbi:hypothetical protein ACLK2F_07945 [Escherichia coli]